MSLSIEEAQRVSDAFFMTLYGIDLHSKWKNLKSKMRFTTEKDFVTWMLDYIIDRERLAIIDQQHQQQQHQQQQTQADSQTYNSVTDGTIIGTADQTAEKQLTPGENILHVNFHNSEVWQNRTDLEHTSPADYAATADGKSLQAAPVVTAKKIVLVRPDNVGKNKEDRLFKCSYCDYRAIKQSHLIMHYRTHTDERPYLCNQCNAKFRNRSHLQRHMASVHQKLKSNQCRHCSYTCARQTDLRRHLVHVHGYESSYKCDYCHKSFFSSQLLEKHVVVHQSEQVSAVASVTEANEQAQHAGASQQQHQVVTGDQMQVVESGALIGFGDASQLVQRVIHNTTLQ